MSFLTVGWKGRWGSANQLAENVDVDGNENEELASGVPSADGVFVGRQ